MRTFPPTPLRSLVTLGIAGLLSFAARPAAACWEGYAATVGPVGILRGIESASWNPAHVREAARWGTRIEAIVPQGAEVSIEFGEITCSSKTGACGSFSTLSMEPDDLPAIFRAVAQAFGAKPAAVRKASKLEPTLYTVQIFAGSERGARRMKARVANLDIDTQGFFTEGGFPARNDPAHVIRDASGPHRVIFDVFLDRDEADDALAELRAKGIRGFVRELPTGKAVGEGEF
ncbi:SPOR domain-containing protein [Polyangium sp. y55x31]|uniref:SPOR domain-containing protein n=1 Tax=Polyangium sp. y55x31 TaxID=3042688 RepID=UPI002482B367|nr:SPOR domain-containing protein [Polyangium sp. y55x31]MDI1477233.1 SPOR domain-containing protein [Polyangium sp. y55x31]